MCSRGRYQNGKMCRLCIMSCQSKTIPSPRKVPRSALASRQKEGFWSVNIGNRPRLIRRKSRRKSGLKKNSKLSNFSVKNSSECAENVSSKLIPFLTISENIFDLLPPFPLSLTHSIFPLSKSLVLFIVLSFVPLRSSALIISVVNQHNVYPWTLPSPPLSIHFLTFFCISFYHVIFFCLLEYDYFD